MALLTDASALLAVVLNEPEKPAIIEATKGVEKAASPLDIDGINTKATIQDIIDALRDSRAGT